jgi:hypothetical protein
LRRQSRGELQMVMLLVTSQFTAQYVVRQFTLMLVQHSRPVPQSAGRVQANTPRGSSMESTSTGLLTHAAWPSCHSQY